VRPWWKPEKGRHCPDCRVSMIARAKITVGRTVRVKWVCRYCGHNIWISRRNPYRNMKYKKGKNKRK